MDIWGFVLLLGLAARATRLITQDRLTEPLRAWIARQPGADPNTGGDEKEEKSRCRTWRRRLRALVAYWVACAWCIGLAISVGAAATWWYWGTTPAWRIIALGATVNLIYATTTTAYAKLDVLIGHLLNLANMRVNLPAARPGGR